VGFYDLSTILSSQHYLIPWGHINGVLYGAVWGLARGQTVRVKSWNQIPLAARFLRRGTAA
jgi:hypothetical protein